MRAVFRFLARLTGVMRILVGAWIVAAPEDAVRVWTGTDRHPGPLVVQSIGARDIVLGSALLVGRRSLRGWLAVTALSDLSDLALAAMSDRLPEERKRVVTIAAGFGAALSLLVMLGAGDRRRRLQVVPGRVDARVEAGI